MSIIVERCARAVDGFQSCTRDRGHEGPCAHPDLPALTARDWQTMINNVVGLVTMGATVVDIHPARWPLVVDAVITFGGPIAHAPVRNADGRIIAFPIGLMFDGNKPIQALLRLWEPCGAEDHSACCAQVIGQGGNYPVPEEQSAILLPQGMRSRGRG